MFDPCLMWLCIQLEATVSNTYTLVQLYSVLLKNVNLPANNLKLISILVDLVLQVIVRQEISSNIVMSNFYHFLNHECVVFLFP